MARRFCSVITVFGNSVLLAAALAVVAITVMATIYGVGQGPSLIQDRSGRQWVASVLSYLDWRSGSSWRSAADRFSPERLEYIAAWRVVNEAWRAPDHRPSLVISTAPAPKPVASVSRARAVRGGAA
jgi:hypothetical protein